MSAQERDAPHWSVSLRGFMVGARTNASQRPMLTHNTSVKATRYGMRRKPGVWRSAHGHTPGLRRMPSRAPYLER